MTLCRVQGSSLFCSQGNNEKRSIKDGNSSRARTCMPPSGTLLMAVAMWPGRQGLTHSFLALLCSPATSSAFVPKCTCNRGNPPDGCPPSRDPTLVSRGKSNFSTKVRHLCIEERFHFPQKDARGKSHVCFLSQCEHVHPSEPNHDSCMSFSSVCFLSLHFTCGLTRAGNSGCVSRDQSLSYFQQGARKPAKWPLDEGIRGQ